MNRKNIWAEKGILLSILALLLIANTIFFLTYRVQYVERLRSLDQRLAESEQSLQRARAARLTAERQYAALRQIQRDLDEVYNRRWATRAERLTVLIGEVKRLAQASNFVPKVYGFALNEASNKAGGSAQPMVGGSSSRRGNPLHASEVSITFNATGTYDQVRRLINLLELSEQFVIVNELTINSSQGGQVTVSLGLKTLFREPIGESVPKSL